MARHTRLEVLTAVNKIGVVPVFYNGDIVTAQNIAKACVNGGIKVLEFTNRGDHAWEVFSALEKFCASELPDAILGAGSVLDAGTASMYISSGACFIVGPVTNSDVAKVCNRRKIGYIPGCGTASEISAAEELGVEIVKVFPGSAVGGPGFVKDLLGPMPWSSIMPTGGVDITEDSLRPWFESGVSAVGMGSKLVSSDILRDGAWDELENRSRDTVELIKSIRGG
ncbi:MAG: bifunctional 4-hydroxy-2-oxoglutarate aldolase/2-dehydro-3-deoxy-phosphogluconate aldolase [Chloroflexota bacterium]|nr:bifunctional 4-hydroxy-2-oxoglutarate aldolase/2-dehydro-3-deoxy-phosphogluconate aldolase [Chloroflexota bacterium]MQG38200.1 bifunctional 4-hydroxy-2-oxoglutarate aldolase/2-dehydro-3-deoxy-phosphogluconate aldolase [SAR202 cluster bacterium]